VSVAGAGCHLGPCATLSGQHMDVVVFPSEANATEFQACAQSGSCRPLCDMIFGELAGDSVTIDDCRRGTADAGSGGGSDQLTLSIRYHTSTCD
jgi:hypothetical protein